MEFTQVEVKAVEVAIEDGKVGDFRELEMLELALVGGGAGDVCWA